MNAVLQQFLTRALFVGTRVSMLMVFAPFFGSGAFPPRIKAVLTVALTLLLYPVYINQPLDPANVNWFTVMLTEFAAGLLMGLTLQFVFEGVQFAGQVIGLQVGYGLETVFDPQTQAETPVVTQFQQSVAILIFLQIGVHYWLLRGLAKSLEFLPPGTVRIGSGMASELVRASGGMMVIGIQIAAPILIATVLIDISMGLIGRASPQLPVMLVGISVKQLVGLGVLGGMMFFWPGVLEGYFEKAMRTTDALLHLAH